MTLPFKSIRVGPFDIPIKTMGPDDAVKSLGLFSAEKMTIWLNPEFESDQIMAETVIHEMTHAIYFVFGVKKRDKQERIVSQISVGMASALRDNPRVFTWLRKKLS